MPSFASPLVLEDAKKVNEIFCENRTEYRKVRTLIAFAVEWRGIGLFKNRVILSILPLMFVLSACGRILSQSTPPLETKTPSLVATTIFSTNSESTVAPSSSMDSPNASQVIVTATVSCRFGPNKAYVPRYRVGVGTFQVIGQDTSGQWLHVYPPGLKNSCWIETQFVKMPVDIDGFAVVPFRLETNIKYKSPENVKTIRSGEQVQISWNDLVLPNEVSPQNRFLLEMWLCANGALTYTLRSTNDLTITVIDQPGCAEASHGQIYTATRIGYSQPTVIPWPAP